MKMDTDLPLNPYDTIASVYDDLFVGNLFYDLVSEKEQQVIEEVSADVGTPGRALDIGCGTGDYTRFLSSIGYDAVGIDLSARMCAEATRKAAASPGRQPEFLQWDARSLAGMGAFDLVLCLGSTLNHLEDWPRFFREVGRVLRPGGRIVLSYDNILGIDSLFWIWKRRGTGYKSGARVRHFIANCWRAGRNLPFHNDWSMTAQDREIVVKLTYQSYRNISTHLRRQSLTVLSRHGVNLLSCLIPGVLSSSADLDPRDTDLRRGVVRRLVLKVEGRVCNVFPGLAANSILVAGKRRPG